MSGITDLPLRSLAKKGGAGLVYTEMVSAKALVRGDEKTKKLLKVSCAEKPVAVQIFGADAYSMAEASKVIRDMGVAEIVDINLGCPVKKVMKAGAGAKLLSDGKLVSKILESVVKSIDVPVTVKIRIGFMPGENVAPEIIRIAQNCGVRMVAVHARYVSQGHSGKPDIESFAAACDSAEVPVIANGGIADEHTAADFLQVPNCRGIMIGRAALGNYSIFRKLGEFFNSGKKLSSPSKEEKVKWLKEHIKYSVEYYGEKKGLVIIRKTAGYYVKNLPDAARIRAMFNKASTLSDFDELIKLF